MRLRGIASKLSQEQREQIGGLLVSRIGSAVRVGSEYTVFGLTFAFGSEVLGTGTWVAHEDGAGNLVLAPLVLFEIIDARASSLWELRYNDGIVELQPAALYAPYFGERLSDGDRAAREQLRLLRIALEQE